MKRSVGSRTLFAICLLVALLTTLAVVQFRWSTRVASADAQREQEHLDSSASQFATEFNQIAGQTIAFLQKDAWTALQTGDPLVSVPKIVAEVYYVDLASPNNPNTKRLTPDGLFVNAETPKWVAIPECAVVALQQPLALVSPVYEFAAAESQGPAGRQVLKTLRRMNHCFVARIDRDYVRGSLIPDLIRHAFGETANQDYTFAVISSAKPNETLYGTPMRVDLRKPFFTMSDPHAISQTIFSTGRAPERPVLFVQKVDTLKGGVRVPLVDLYGPGIWELQVAHKGLPLTDAFQQARWREMLLSMIVELVLAATIIFIMVVARRMQRLADQKMRFVAGVSHELRTPVSAIAMLSRNQADGLVTGGDKVKQYGELIHIQSRRLNAMVEQTLQYAGIQSGLRRPEKRDIDLRTVIHDAVSATFDELTASGFEVEVALAPDLPALSGDPALLRMALDNILSNAKHYSGSGHWIRVSAVYSEGEREVQISVEDRGMGVSPAEQVEIFEAFYRGRAVVDAQLPGSGLGLSLVRSAVEAHHGKVSLKSTPGSGSTFTMHLPL
jgi:two-component system sensor histidine kinase SenX3